jgi:hypothetical protein
MNRRTAGMKWPLLSIVLIITLEIAPHSNGQIAVGANSATVQGSWGSLGTSLGVQTKSLSGTGIALSDADSYVRSGQTATGEGTVNIGTISSGSTCYVNGSAHADSTTFLGISNEEQSFDEFDFTITQPMLYVCSCSVRESDADGTVYLQHGPDQNNASVFAMAVPPFPGGSTLPPGTISGTLQPGRYIFGANATAVSQGDADPDDDWFSSTSDVTFSLYLGPTLPTVETDPASNITMSGATLNGVVNPNNNNIATAIFEYGAVSSGTYTNIASAWITSGTDQSLAQNISSNIAGLFANTKYHYRLTVTTGGLSISGSDVEFSTPVAPTKIWTNPASGLWDISTNWSGSSVPTTSDDVLIQLQPSTELTVSGPSSSTEVASLTIGVPDGKAILSLNQSGNLTIDGALTVNSGGAVATNGASLSCGSLLNGGYAFVLSNGVGSPSVMTVNGNFLQSDSGLLNLSLYGENNAENDFVNVSGTASVSGILRISLGRSDGNDFFLPNTNDFFTVMTAPAVTGSFSSDDANSIEATFNYFDPDIGQTTGQLPGVIDIANQGDAGIFQAIYNPTSILLTRFHQIHVLSIGVTDDGKLRGINSAVAVAQAFQDKLGVTDDRLIRLTAQNPSANVDLVTKSIIASSVQPGDTFIFYINCHSGAVAKGNETPYQREDQQHVTSGPSFLGLGGTVTSPNEWITASTLSGLFSGSRWAQVNKVFILDTCYAGGYWTGFGNVRYLSSLPHSAIIAAAPESAVSLGGSNGGYLGQAIATIIKNSTSTMSTQQDFYTLLSQSADQAQDDLVIGHYSGYIEDEPSQDYGKLISAASLNISGTTTDDFSLGLSNQNSSLPFQVRNGVPPLITTGTIATLGSSSATLTGNLDSYLLPTETWFEFGSTLEYGSKTPVVISGTASLISEISAAIAGLRGHSNYHYRAVAKNSGGTFYGTDMKFQTLDNPPVGVDDLLLTSSTKAVAIDPLLNDLDPDGDHLSVTDVSAATDGTTLAGKAKITYSPSASFTGLDSFSYSMNDGYGGSGSADVYVMNPALDGLVTLSGTPVGTMTMKLTANRAFTSSIRIQGIRFGLVGAFDQNGAYTGTKTVGRVDPFSIWLSFSPSTGSVTGTFSNGENYSVNLKDYVSSSGTLAKTRVTGVLSAAPESGSLSATGGVTVGSCDSNGNMLLSGRLGDGTPYSLGSHLHGDGSWIFYAGFKRHGTSQSIIGSPIFETLPASDCDGALYSYTASGSSINLNGTSDFSASFYQSPGKGQVVLPFTGSSPASAKVSGTGGGLSANFSENVLVSTSGAITNSDSSQPKVKLTINLTSGFVFGSIFTGTAPRSPLTVFGVDYQKQNLGGLGIVSGPASKGLISLTPQ